MTDPAPSAPPAPRRWPDLDRPFTRFANTAARFAGKPGAFILCALVVVAWAVTGPIFHFSQTWQLVINTGTTIVTFLMVFLIQNEQNRDSAAIQAKLDELIRTSAADNFYVGIEHLTDRELAEIIRACEAQAKRDRQAVVAEDALPPGGAVHPG